MRHVFEPVQQQAFRYAEGRKHIALFMEMRLGKSPVVIRWATARHAKRILLIAPLSTLLGELNWQGELKREGITPTILSAFAREKRMSLLRPSHIRCINPSTPDDIYDKGPAIYHFRRYWAHGWFAVNYEAIRTQPEILHAPWDAIILDESTRIRNPKAQVTKILLRHTDHIPNRALLTGLPNPESPQDYFCQFVFLDGRFLGFDNYWVFRKALFYQGYTQWDWQPRSGTRAKMKAYIHSHAFVMSRKQAKVGSTKVRKQRSVELNAQQSRLLREMRTTFEVDGVETKWRTVVETWTQRVAGGFHPTTLEMISDAKIRLAEELVMDEFRHEPVVMWFRFNEEIRAMRRWLEKRHRRFRVEHVHGKVKAKDRPTIQERFQRGDTNLLLMQVKLGRYGWNLSRSSTAIYYSNTYEFEDRSQSEDRLIHLKKRDTCLYIDLVTLGTPDEAVVSALNEKRSNARFYNTQMRASVDRLFYAA